MSVKTLIVDDETTLLEQAEVFLERIGKEIEVSTVNSVEKALDMLEDDDFDVIVSDYQMPKTNGLEFLKEIREERNCDLPFIMFTGKGREKVAIKALNLGADRYLQKKGTPKSQYEILGDSISQEHKYNITEKERERYTSELEFLNDVILNVNKMKSTDEICEYIADKVHSLNDDDYVTVSLYDREEEFIRIRALKGFDDHPELVERLIHSDDKPIFDPDLQDEWSDIYSSGELEMMPEGVYSLVKGVLSKEEAEEIEELLGIEEVYSVGFAVDNKPYGSLSIYKTSGEDVEFSSAIETISNHISEILQRRQSEDKLRKSREEIKKSQKKYKSLFNSIRDAILVADTDRNIINCNQAFTDIFGYELDEIKGKKTKYVYHDEKQFEEMGDEIREKMGERDFYYTIDYEKKSGEVFPGETNVFYLRGNENEITGFIGIIRDVTEQHTSKEKLQESEEKYRRLFESSQDGILIVDAETGVIKDSNPYLQEILGYSKEELFGKKLWKLSTFKNIIENEKKFKKLVEKGYIRYEDITIKTKDGQEVPIEFVSNSYQAGGKKVVQCNIRKIIERTKIKEKLENKHRQLRTLIDNVPGMAYRCLNNENWTMKFLSDGCEELTGYKPKDLIDDNKLAFSDLIKPEDKKSIKNQVQEALKKAEPFQLNYQIKTAEGETKWVWARGRGIYDEDGDVQFLEGFIQDITERKENQQKLKQKERYLDHTPSFINVIDEEGEIKYLSFPPNKIEGLDPSDIVGSEGFEFIHPDDREEAERIFSKCLEDPGKEYKTELRGETKDGWTWLEVRAVNYLDDPKINGIIVNTLDINQKKRIEKKLRESKNRLDLALKGAELGTWDWNVKTDQVQFDEKWAEMLGCSLNEIEKNRDCWEKRVHPDDLPRVDDKLEKHLQGETELFKVEHRMKTKSGDWIWIKSVGKVIEKDEDGNPVRAVGIHEDITERKKAEQKLKESEEKYRTMIESANDAIFIRKEDGFVDCNEKAPELFGCDRKDILSAEPFEFSPEKQPDGKDSREKAREKIDKALQGEPQEFEWVHTKKNGEPFHTVVTLNGYTIDDEKFVMGIVKDITERKLAEEEIKYRENLERIITEVSTSLMNVQVEKIDERIDQALKKIGEFAGADRSYVFQFSEDLDKMDTTHEW